VILPWNDPLRVAEKMIMLDILSGGRAVFGMGRGLSRTEYDQAAASLELFAKEVMPGARELQG
jgi:alkanesulfonate monooxygenase SsuD/methylene tetrahydromethanopterin reductase-like flavin-dependent oxidoreductase (luciferase family)